jgi:hypothetical protein
MKNSNIIKFILLLVPYIFIKTVVCDSIVPVDSNTYTSKIEKLVIENGGLLQSH